LTEKEKLEREKIRQHFLLSKAEIILAQYSTLTKGSSPKPGRVTLTNNYFLFDTLFNEDSSADSVVAIKLQDIVTITRKKGLIEDIFIVTKEESKEVTYTFHSLSNREDMVKTIEQQMETLKLVNSEYKCHECTKLLNQ